MAAQRNTNQRGQRWTDLVTLCRPWQWVKNVFVLAPLLFTPGAWALPTVSDSLLAALCFCLLSSSVYCLNDVLDTNADSLHPRKRHRPMPAGRLSVGSAVLLAVLLAICSLFIAILFLPWGASLCGGLYLANSLAYCLVLKHRVIADVMSIAIGFVLRLVGGCVAIGVPPSTWLLVCGFSLAMLLAFGKRRLELQRLDQPADHRLTLISYDVPKLNMLLCISASVCLLSYMLYTVAPQTVARHQTDQLVFTVPFVAYGVFRYLFKVQEGRHDSPVEVLFTDPIFVLNGLLWTSLVIAVLLRPAIVFTETS